MKIEISSLEFAFSVLENAHLLGHFVQDEPWKDRSGVSVELEKITKLGGMGYASIEMPFPLETAGFACRRIGDTYKVLVLLSARDKSCFDNLSRTLEEKMGDGEYKFFKTTDNGTGHILNAEKKPIISIMDLSESIREINIGNRGSCERTFADYDQFVEDVAELVDFVNIYINACLSSPECKRRTSEFQGDITLYLTP